MFTPQQIEQISFGKQTFGGYDMQAFWSRLPKTM